MNRQYAQAWKFLKQQLARVIDPILRNTMMAEFRQRALSGWGFDPDNGNLAQDDDIVLNDWEQGLVQDMELRKVYGVDPRKAKREHEIKEARARMRIFIEHGGSLSDIPDDIRTPYITQMYLDESHNLLQQTLEEANALIS